MMKRFISLAIVSLATSVFMPGATQAQTSVPTSPETSPNSSPVAPNDSGVPLNATPRNTPATPSNSATPTTATPSTMSGMGTCGMASSGTSMTPSGGGMISSKTNSSTYTTSTSSSLVPLTKLNTNPALSATAATPNDNVAPRLLDASSDEVEYINLIGPSHYVKLSVGSSPLCYLSVTPLQEVYATDSIKVLDQSGKSVPAVVTKQDNGSAKISFEQPISAGQNLVLAMQGVEYDSTLTPTTVQYYISGGFANYSQEIPYGVAQIQRYRK